MGDKNIIVGSPVYQKPEILKAFLHSLKSLDYHGGTLDFIFVDDNAYEESSRMLSDFCSGMPSAIIIKGTGKSSYVCDVESHHWNDSLMLKVADYKNTMIRYAIDHGYDGLFLVDSDLVLHPDLLMHLERQHKEVVSEIFWSQWHQGLPLEPNVWLFDEYDLVPRSLGETLSPEEETARQADFMEKLRSRGLFEVGGLGACTLIRRSALIKGVNFSPISNLTIHGEDRFFCIRAAVLGVRLYVDTCFPAYHIYREADLAGVQDYRKRCRDEVIRSDQGKNGRNRITLSMTVRNEEGNYLERMLKSLSGHIDEAVIIDDASTDRTVRICRTQLADIPLKIISNKESMFADEVSLRKKQWEETIKTNPQWILNLDADEILMEEFWDDAGSILDDPARNYCDFRLYDMWNETQYREDGYWSAHKCSRTFLLRYDPDFLYSWHETPQHCGRFPANFKESAGETANGIAAGEDGQAIPKYRIQHMGWSTPEDRERKYKRYRQLDPGAVYGVREQYDSILDREPRLLAWQMR